jgi:wyosine [tRNA(Phe)-imidazoG37] synthetase (radical SAM superfamily)
MQKPQFNFFIDIVGTCNLRCPSCPIGNMSDVVNDRGLMSPDLLKRILDKATNECSVTNVGLFNWTEPFLHPRLDEMVGIVHQFGLACAVSTNLNINKPDRYSKLMEAAPNVLRVSLSGISQDTYGITHKGGTVERVFRNLEELMQIKENIKSPTRIAVAFHRYLSNLNEENALKEYCEKIGVVFQPMNALMLPLEKVLAFCGDRLSTTKLNDDDHKTINNLALPLAAALHESAQVLTTSCKLLEEQIVLNCRGHAMLCCASYDEGFFSIGNYLESNLTEIQNMRRKHSICNACVNNGISNYFQYNIPKMDELVLRNIQRGYKRFQ